FLVATGEARLGADRGGERRSGRFEPPAWVESSPLLDAAFSLAVTAHGDDRRPSDGRLFVEHVSSEAKTTARRINPRLPVPIFRRLHQPADGKWFARRRSRAWFRIHRCLRIESAPEHRSPRASAARFD